MKRVRCLLLGGLVMLSSCLTACGTQEKGVTGESRPPESESIEFKSEAKCVHEIMDDGWVYTFDYKYIPGEPEPESGMFPFAFNVINLRHTVNGHIQIKGLSDMDTPAVVRDIDKTGELLGYDGYPPKKAELLSLTEDDLDFEELDETQFIRLMHTALEGEDHKKGKFIDMPSYAMLCEPAYVSDYKLQIGFLSCMGWMDVIMIDVLYRTGDTEVKYTQLSDMVQNGTATKEQKKAYQLIKDIEKAIVADNEITKKAAEHKDEVIAGIDFRRVYSFLKDIEVMNFDKY